SALSLRQYGFLLATAPLAGGTRSALLKAMGLLPGVHSCDAVFPNHPAHDAALCVEGNPTGTEILLDRRTGVVTAVCERLGKPASLYPNMAVGALVDCYSFSRQASTSS